MTWRELRAASFAVHYSAWNHTASIRMEIRNAAFGRRRASQFKDVHPLYKKRQKPKQLNKEQSKKLLDSVFKGWRSAE